MNLVEITPGDSPLILAMPHTGLFVPDEILEKFNANGRNLSDTDWHIEKLYKDLVPGATTVRALFHRYVIDANRAPSDESLYPGQNTTGLCPVTDFDGLPIYHINQQPDAAQIEQRRETFHAPYHAALQKQIERIYERFGIAVLYDCHSIRSHIPFLFEGKLPDFNIGTNNGLTCSTDMESRVVEICANAESFTSILNGRFKGGWTTRNYGRRQENFHAIQMELAQSTHLASEKLPFDYSSQKAERLRPYLRLILEELTRQAFEITKKG
jgi:N-formylglutamate deformylase